MGDHDRRDAQPADDVHHLVSVDTAVDAVLMLDDGDVALVQQFGACCYAMSLEPLTSSPMTRALEEGDPSATRTTLTSAPFAHNPSDRAALNVASPQGVGG